MKELEKKILIIALSLSEKNGTGRYSISLIDELANFYCLKIFSGQETDARTDFKNSEISLILPALPSGILKMRHPAYFLRALWKIWRLAKKENVALVHSFMDFPHSFLAALLAKLLRKPLFLTVHGTYTIRAFNRTAIDRWLNVWSLKQARRVFCVSCFAESELKKRLDLKNTLVINNGIDFGKFQRDSVAKKDSSQPRLISVGALKFRKGYHVLIPALAEIKKRYPNFLQLIIGDQGDTEYFDSLKLLVNKFVLENNVKFLEKISDEALIDYYYQSDVFVLTSVNVNDAFEGFGLVFLEAGACGLPAVGTLGCGAEDAIADGQTGFLVNQEDSQATAKAILKLLADPQLAARLGAAGRERAKIMDWRYQAEKYMKAYAE